MFILLCILTATLRFDVNEACQIPKGYEFRNDGLFYKKSEAKATWQEAVDICQKDGAVLAIINDKTTNDIVGSYFDTKRIWINCNDMEKERIFETIDKQRCSYTNWAPGEPNNYNGMQHCVQIWKDEKNYWDDFNCLKINNYVCQFRMTDCQIPKGYEFRNDGHFYKKSEAKATWQEAVDICQKDGAVLAIIDDKTTNDIVGSYFDTKRIWINCNDMEKERIFETIDKQSCSYTNWAPGEPNNYDGQQHCVQIWKYEENYWDDFNCILKNNYVCQFRMTVLGAKLTCPVPKPQGQYYLLDSPEGTESTMSCDASTPLSNKFGRLVAKVESGSGVHIYNKILAASKGEPGLGMSYDPTGSFIDHDAFANWKKAFANGGKVRFTLWKKVDSIYKPAVNIIFNGTGSDAINWFDLDRVLVRDAGPDVTLPVQYDSWSMKGHSNRNFYINHYFVNCKSSTGMLYVLQSPDPCDYQFEAKKFPFFGYSNKVGICRWKSNTKCHGEAQRLTISILP